jgi:hypothetical protein
LSEASLEIIRSVDWSRADAADGAALLWYVGNRRFFELGLDRRGDVLPVSYDAVVRSPDAAMRVICAFLGLDWAPELAAGIDDRALARREPLPLDPAIRDLCATLAGRLDDAAAAAGARIPGVG